MRPVMAEERVGLVLAGGGARGAYEVGALSVLLPALEARGERPTVLVGASVGGMNVAYLAANADLSADEVVAGGVALWRALRWDQVLGPLLAPSTVFRAFCYAADALGVPRAMLTGLFDTRPLGRTVTRVIDFERLHRNIDAGFLDATAVVGTSAATTRSVVFVEGHPVPGENVGKGIDCVATRLDGEHVRASAAIPSLFPAVHVSRPSQAQGWYIDRGVRLNAPLRPALSLAVDRVVVIGLNAIPQAPSRLASEHRPDAFRGAADFLNGTLINQLVEDVRRLGTRECPSRRPSRPGHRNQRLALPSRPLHLHHPTSPRGCRESGRANLRRALRGSRGAALDRLSAVRASDRRRWSRTRRPVVLPVLRPRVRHRFDRTRAPDAHGG